MKKQTVKQLGLSYRFKDGLAVFEDGVSYTPHEMIVIAQKGGTDKEMQKLHEVKKLFDGEILW